MVKSKIELYKRGRLGLKQLELNPFMEEPKARKTYKQDWRAYNLAQTNELPIFMDTLVELIDSLIQVRNKSNKNGRPFSQLKDMIFCCVLKVYFGKSSRRNIGYLNLAKEKGYIEKIPHFNTILNYYKNPLLTNLLIHMVEQSGTPLKDIEQNFATDSSGFSTSLYGRWFDIRLKDYSHKKLWRKAHVTSGVKTNIITAVSITEGFHHDCPEFGELVKVTAKNFLMREMTADAGYLARDNFELVSSVGAIPYIMFRSNCSSHARGSLVYKRMYEMYKNHKEEFLAHYHQRSNAESVFSMIKRKFGLKLYSRSETAQTNELLCIILAHNICVLIQELFESNTILNFEDCQKVFVRNGYCANA